MNMVKTFLLMFGLLFLLYFIGVLLNLSQGTMITLLMVGMGFNFAMYWFSDKMVLMGYGAQPLNEAEAPEIYRMVRRLTQKAEMPMPRLYIIDDPAPNAFATGRNPEHAVVAMTRGIVNLLSDDELEGVLAHELSHVKNRDMLISTIAAGLAMAITYAGHFAGFFMGGHRDDREEGVSPVAGIMLMILAPLAAMLVQMAVSRSREYGADHTGGLMTRKPMALARALRKISSGIQANAPLEGAKPETAHLMIANPFSGGGIAALFSTHPAAEKRIQELEALDRAIREGREG
jgi:heat shock protein HtpX